MFEGEYAPPYYLDLYGFLDGAQDDIFEDSFLSIPTPGPNQTTLPVLNPAAMVPGQRLAVPNLDLLPPDYLPSATPTSALPSATATTSATQSAATPAETVPSDGTAPQAPFRTGGMCRLGAHSAKTETSTSASSLFRYLGMGTYERKREMHRRGLKGLWGTW